MPELFVDHLLLSSTEGSKVLRRLLHHLVGDGVFDSSRRDIAQLSGLDGVEDLPCDASTDPLLVPESEVVVDNQASEVGSVVPA